MSKFLAAAERPASTLPTAADVDFAYPEVAPNVRVTGNRILVQMPRSRTASKGGIMLIEETQQTERLNNTTGRLVQVGPSAFRDRTSLELWKEGAWAEVGDFVRVIKWGGDRFVRPAPDGEGDITFTICEDVEIFAVLEGNPLRFKAANL